MKAFVKTFDKDPSDLKPADLKDCFQFMDGAKENSGTVRQTAFEECIDENTPKNEDIVKDILENGGKGTKADIVEALKAIPNIRPLKGKILVGPFVAALTKPPIEMTKLDAKFLAALFKDPKNPQTHVDAKKLLKQLGYYLPPDEELYKLKKAIKGNDMDMNKVFARTGD